MDIVKKLVMLFQAAKMVAFVSCVYLLSVSPVRGQDVGKYIPQKCAGLVPIVKQETRSYLPDVGSGWYFGALVEHESCISLKHSKCCSPNSQLKTTREWGAGVGQITKAYNSDGSVRFDALSDLKNRYKAELKELTWDNVLMRPDLQVRAMVLLTKGNYNTFFPVKDNLERLRMTDSAYNGGAKAVTNARTVCGMAKGCDPQVWFGNVERYINKSKKPIYAGRSALDINLHHVKDVTVTRKDKYRALYQ